MNGFIAYVKQLVRATILGWNEFFFTPADPATLGAVRIAAGAMLFYTHLVWSLALDDFFGPTSWINAIAARDGIGPDYRWAWSYFWWIDSTWLLRTAHLAALAIFAMLTVGLATRCTSILAAVAAISYANRVPGALYGLDQINVMLALYLAVGPAGDAWSLDRWLAARRQGSALPVRPSVGANLAIRLIQCHMCVIYFFAGLSKLQGSTWWDGTALWFAFASYEYQTIDMTWLADWPITIALLTTITVYWELLFFVLVWPRILRPAVMFVAIPLHLGIGLCLGMMTFGLAMLIGVASFLPPETIRGWRGEPAG